MQDLGRQPGRKAREPATTLLGAELGLNLEPDSPTSCTPACPPPASNRQPPAFRTGALPPELDGLVREGRRDSNPHLPLTGGLSPIELRPKTDSRSAGPTCQLARDAEWEPRRDLPGHGFGGRSHVRRPAPASHPDQGLNARWDGQRTAVPGGSGQIRTDDAQVKGLPL